MNAPRFIMLSVMCVTVFSKIAHASFDGVYRGTHWTTSNDNSQYCQKFDNKKDRRVIIKDNKFRIMWDKWTEVEIKPDGNFLAYRSFTPGERRNMILFTISGVIVGDILEADFGTKFCKVRMRVQKFNND